MGEQEAGKRKEMDRQATGKKRQKTGEQKAGERQETDKQQVKKRLKEDR